MRSIPEAPSHQDATQTRRFAIIACGVLLIDKLSSYFILSSHRFYSFDLDLYLNIQTFILCWLVPIVVVLKIEKRKAETLGLTLGKLRLWFHAILFVVSIVLPLIILGMDRSLVVLVLEQIFFVAFAEELLWRGYFQRRLADWIGPHTGVLVTSLLFGLGHIVTIHAVEGYVEWRSASMILLQTTMGGLIFGYLFHWSKSIWPGAFLHLFGNVFLFRLI